MLFAEKNYLKVIERIENESIKAIKIIDNLYLGDQHSTPDFIEKSICCAEELFPYEKSKGQNIFELDNKIYFNFKDFPNAGQIDPYMVKRCLEVIKENINNKTYIHCLWGVNRSASMVFMYLVKNELIEYSNFQKAKEAFIKIYPPFEPNTGWEEYLELNFPYKF